MKKKKRSQNKKLQIKKGVGSKPQKIVEKQKKVKSIKLYWTQKMVSGNLLGEFYQ